MEWNDIHLLKVGIPIPWGSFMILFLAGIVAWVAEHIFEKDSKAMSVVSVLMLIALLAAIVVGYMQLQSWGYI